MRIKVLPIFMADLLKMYLFLVKAKRVNIQKSLLESYLENMFNLRRIFLLGVFQ
jgi:hypothetical protein